MKFRLDSSKLRIFPSTSSPSTGWKFSFWVLSETLVKATVPSITVTALFPKRILLLALTVAPKPIAVALFRLPVDTSAKAPMAVLGSYPWCWLAERVDSAGDVVRCPWCCRRGHRSPLAVLALTRGVVKERTGPAGGIVSRPRSCYGARPTPLAVFCCACGVARSAWTPLAVLLRPSCC